MKTSFGGKKKKAVGIFPPKIHVPVERKGGHLFSTRLLIPSIALSVSKHFDSIFIHSGGGSGEGGALGLWLCRPP